MSGTYNTPESAAARTMFATTHWSLVLSAREAATPAAADALSKLCQTYWYPLYAYVRRRGYDIDESQDLTQEFFARLLAKDFLASVRRERGKFRWFLLCALKRFLTNEWKREQAAKRGGQHALLSLDETEGELRYGLEVADHVTPDTLYDRTWALTLLEQARQALEREYVASGRGVIFNHLKVFLSGDRAPMSMAEAGVFLGITEGAVKVAVHRLRQRYRECLREAIAQTVMTPAEVDEEIRQLFAVFA